MSRLVFFGNERIATGAETTVPTLQALIKAGYDIAAVIVAQGDASNSRKKRPLEIALVADEAGIPILTPRKLTDILETLASHKADAGVLVAYGKLVPQSVIDLFPGGIINIHPSLLPAHRGSIPIESVILSGEVKTGVSLMQLVREMDAGPIYIQKSIALTGGESKQELADQLLRLGKDLLIGNLPAILGGTLKPKAQSENNVTYDQRLNKNDGLLLPDKWDRPAYEIVRMVRAFSGWPRVRTTLAGTEIIITESHSVADAGTPGVLWVKDQTFGVYAKDSSVVIDRLIPIGKKEISAAEFLLGYKLTF